MIFRETELPGAWILEPERIEDERGFFARTWDARALAERGLDARIAQCNVSSSTRRGTVRGLHFQRPPHEETKLVRCTRGAIYDVLVDLRPDSPAYRRWTGVELTADDRRTLYVPRGFAHGFQTLDDDTEVLYLMSEFHAPDAAAGVRWDDPAFGIELPLGAPTAISERDRSWPDFTG
jgi:dTDP-4-dehydrorhamnose 3,5-epimerase